MSEPFEKSHFQCRTLWRWHPSQSTSNLFQSAVQLGAAGKVRFDGYNYIGDIRLWASLAEGIDCPVARDHGQPPWQAPPSGIECVRITPELHENFLQNVLSRPGFTQNTQRHRINNRRVALVELRHGLLIAGANRRHQRGVRRKQIGGRARKVSYLFLSRYAEQPLADCAPII